MSRIAKLIILILLLLAVALPVVGSVNATHHEGDGSQSTQAGISYFVDWVH